MIFHTSFGAASETAQDPQLLSDSSFVLEDYEILSFHGESDEDVIHLRKRVDEEQCATDCLTYSGWSEDGLMQCEPEDESSEDALEARYLVERGRKSTTPICGSLLNAGVPQTPINLISPTWPKVKVLEQKYAKVYDIGDPTEPLKPDWFELKSRDKRWTKDLVGRNTKSSTATRCYAAEHVLEWQLLQIFIEADIGKGDKSRCAFLLEHFQADFPKTKHKVQVAKNNGALAKSGHFDYEEKDFEFDKWRHNGQMNPRMIDWISFQWPGTSSGWPPNPWEYELILLNQDANGRKSNIWAENEIFKDPKTEDNTQNIRQTEENSKSLELLFVNKYYEKKVAKNWPDRMGTCKAIYQFATLMNLVQYHNDALIKEIMRAQVTRIGEAWEYLEKTILAGTTSANNKAFVERGLKKEWIDWMKDRHKVRLEKVMTTLKNKIVIFEGKSSFITKLKRWDYGGVFRRDVEIPNCGTETDPARMQKRIELLLAAYKDLKAVDSDLKL
ncbi:hypothetical protein NX059_008673 [Plenodomus lindquistii]|nr:hypothetical protein NX059_008673 [Plenodomus lindquistii]